jgi:hypothetical protein
VEGRDPHAAGTITDEFCDSLLHLSSGLIGKGDGENLEGGGTAFGHEIGDSARQNSSLA